MGSPYFASNFPTQYSNMRDRQNRMEKGRRKEESRKKGPRLIPSCIHSLLYSIGLTSLLKSRRRGGGERGGGGRGGGGGLPR